MRLETLLHAVAFVGQAERFANISARLLRYNWPRRLTVRYMDRLINQRLEEPHRFDSRRPPRVVQDKAYIARAIVHSMARAVARGHLAPAMMRGTLRGLIMNGFMRGERRGIWERYHQEHGGYGPPSFLVIGPGKLCNLRCQGCYASSGADHEKLDWEVFDRIVTEAQTLWGTGFFVLTGGEPLIYRSQGKGGLEVAAKHPDAFFLMFTNGTLIDERMATHLAEVGNLTPAISLEGFEERTDARRGKGVFRRILRAMAHLREAGVPFGISLTATRENCEEILSDEFLDYFFEEQGAIYGWIFQYMPIGRGFTLELLPTPEQRAWMWRRTWEVVREKKYFLADFWNLGTCSDGCISAGRAGGYLYFDWSGKVMPCVFVPYSPVNINDAYRQGKKLDDILDEPFFRAIRQWQHAYGFLATKPEDHGNWLMPCIIRDHHADFRRILEMTEPDPEDEAALQALLDPNYSQGLIRYNEAVAQVLDPIWEREYLRCDNQETARG